MLRSPFPLLPSGSPAVGPARCRRQLPKSITLGLFTTAEYSVSISRREVRPESLSDVVSSAITWPDRGPAVHGSSPASLATVTSRRNSAVHPAFGRQPAFRKETNASIAIASKIADSNRAVTAAIGPKRAALRLLREAVLPYGFLRELNSGGKAQFGVHVRQVCLHSAWGDEQSFRDVLIRQPLAHQARHIQFGRGQ
jgi:hypothetical protein